VRFRVRVPTVSSFAQTKVVKRRLGDSIRLPSFFRFKDIIYFGTYILSHSSALGSQRWKMKLEV
jgi:hypothetical protein